MKKQFINLKMQPDFSIHKSKNKNGKTLYKIYIKNSLDKILVIELYENLLHSLPLEDKKDGSIK